MKKKMDLKEMVAYDFSNLDAQQDGKGNCYSSWDELSEFDCDMCDFCDHGW